MELRQYWDVIWRRRWFVLAVIVLAGLFSAFSLLTAARTYETEVIFTVRYPGDFGAGVDEGEDPGAGANVPVVFSSDYAAYYRYLSSEYQVDDFTQVIESDAFGNAILKTMQEELSAGRVKAADLNRYTSDLSRLRSQDIVDMVGADRRHRELRVFVEAPTRDLARNIMDTTGVVLTEARYQPVRGKILDQPVFGQLDAVTDDDLKSSTSREITNAIVRVVMGIVAALALAFLLEYLDTSIRDERDVQKTLDLPVIGSIPRT